MRSLPRLLQPLALLVAFAPLAHAKLPLEAAARLYSQQDVIRLPQVSPDGSAIAYVTTVDGHDALVVVHRATGRSDLAAKAFTNIINFVWKSDRQLVFLGNGLGGRTGHLYLVDLAAKKQRYLVDHGETVPQVIWFDPLEGNPARMLVVREQTERAAISSPSQRNRAVDPNTGGVRIGAVDLDTGKFTITEPYDGFYSRSGAYVADRTGALRFRVQYKPNELLFQQRASDNDAFTTFGSAKWTDPETRFLGFGSDPNILYSVKFDAADAGRVVELDARTGAEGKELYRAPSGQIDEGIFSPDHSRLEGVLTFDSVRRAHWFNERLAGFQRAIDSSLPGRVNDPLNFSRDETVALVRSSTSSDRGDLYLFDASHGAKILIGRLNPKIDPAQQGRMTAVTIPARDGFSLHGYLVQPNDGATGPRPLIVEPQQNLDYRWVIGFGDRVQMLVSQGYAVLLVDYRGTWGYGYAYAHAGELQLADAIPNDVNDAAQWAIKSGAADPKRVALLGYRTGAIVALTAATRAPGLYKCLVNEEGIADLDWIYENQDRYDWYQQKAFRYVIKIDKDYLLRASAMPHLDQLPDAIFNIYRDAFHSRDWYALRAGLESAHKHYTAMTDLPRALFHPPEELAYNTNVQLLQFLAQNL